MHADLTIPEVSDIAGALDRVNSPGFVVLRGGGEAALAGTLRALGEVFFVFEVKTRPDSPALVATNRAFALHTDNHRARWIVWYCDRQAEHGGHSLVVDGLQALSCLTEQQQQALAGVQLIDPRAPAGTVNRHPMLTRSPDGRTQLYYGHLLADDAMTQPERAAYEAFTAAVGAAEVHRSLLGDGDLLIVDNHRVLHGRTAFQGDQRHLTRYWLRARPPAGGDDRARR